MEPAQTVPAPTVPDTTVDPPELPYKRAGMRHNTATLFLHAILIPFLITRGILVTVGYLALELLPHAGRPGQWEFSSHHLINMWSRWDAGWYLSIAEQGYHYHPGEQSNVNFAPLLPLMMRTGSLLTQRTDHESMLVTGIVIANAALLVALYYLVLLARIDFSERTAQRCAWYLLLYPSSLFLSAIYPESLFLALAIPAFYQARQGRWWLACLLAGLAALARPHGITLLIPLLYEYLAQRKFQWRSVKLDAAALALIPAIFLLWPLHLYTLFGDGFLFVKSQTSWGRVSRPPWQVIDDFFSAPLVTHGPDHSLVDLCFTLTIVLLIMAGWDRLRRSYSIMLIVTTLVIISSGSLSAIMRYSLELFPLFIILGVYGRRSWFDRIYVPLAMGLGCFFMTLYALWYFLA